MRSRMLQFFMTQAESIQMLVNNLTSNGYDAFASDSYSGYAPYIAYNGTDKSQTSSGWQDNNSGAPIGKFLGRHVGATAKIFRQLKIWNGQWNGSIFRASLKDIVVEGSNDAVVGNNTGALSTIGTWTKIPVAAIVGGSIINTDEARIDAGSGTGVAASSTITLGGSTAYKAVRIRITSSPWDQNYGHVREMEIYVVQ